MAGRSWAVREAVSRRPNRRKSGPSTQGRSKVSSSPSRAVRPPSHVFREKGLLQAHRPGLIGPQAEAVGEGAGGVGQGSDVLPPSLLGRQVHEGEEGALHLADLMQEVSSHCSPPPWPSPSGPGPSGPACWTCHTGAEAGGLGAIPLPGPPPPPPRPGKRAWPGPGRPRRCPHSPRLGGRGRGPTGRPLLPGVLRRGRPDPPGSRRCSAPTGRTGELLPLLLCQGEGAARSPSPAVRWRVSRKADTSSRVISCWKASRSFRSVPSSRARAGSRVISGREAFRSHLLTAVAVTPQRLGHLRLGEPPAARRRLRMMLPISMCMPPWWFCLQDTTGGGECHGGVVAFWGGF